MIVYVVVWEYQPRWDETSTAIVGVYSTREKAAQAIAENMRRFASVDYDLSHYDIQEMELDCNAY